MVWFGEGQGVLREAFLEHLEREDGLLLVDLAGETRERPQEAMGLVLRADLHARLVQALAPGAPTARDPAPASEPRGGARRPPASGPGGGG